MKDSDLQHRIIAYDTREKVIQALVEQQDAEYRDNLMPRLGRLVFAKVNAKVASAKTHSCSVTVAEIRNELERDGFFVGFSLVRRVLAEFAAGSETGAWSQEFFEFSEKVEL